MKYLILVAFTLLISVSFAQRTKRNSSTNYESKTLMLKVKDAFRADCKANAIVNSRLEYILGKVGVVSLLKEYPRHEKPVRAKHANGISFTDISLIYKLKYNSNDDPWTVIPHLLKTGMFEYAEPSFKFELLYTSNDPQLSDIYYLDTINAYEAWDVTKGDTNVVIGISDTGFDIDHPDLVDNVKYNYLDPINGIDDDNDGYIDNYRGWDLGESDDDPTVGASWHGIFVSGIAGASTDNSNQLAGVGFKCKLLPIKITDAGGALTAAYNSIIYAADHGCSVINCSWGSPNSWSQLGQDMVKYATVDKNCLVVASAGNSNAVDKFYPASFDWALSVGGTDTLNQKWVQSAGEGSNYNEEVDIVAPAVDITRINNNGGTLGSGRGTSFSSPMIAGAAAIVKSQFPSYSAIQVMEQLKATADDLSGIPFNSAYEDKMGEGLVNMYRSVTETSYPGFYMDGLVFTDSQDGLFTDGETVYIYGTLFNALATSTAASKMTISTTSPYIEWVDSVRVFGSIASGSSGSTSGIPFSFKVKEGTPASSAVEFKIVFEDVAYDTKQIISTTLNVDYITTSINDLGFTIGASGKLGYNVVGSQSQGVGLQVSGGSTVLYQMGLLAAVDGIKSSFVLDGDWETNKDLSYTYPGVESALDIMTSFKDDPATNSIGLTLNQKTLVWTDSDKRKFIIVEYNVKNTSGAPITGLNLGIFADWDINAYNNNIAVYDSTIKTGYSYEPAGTYAGVHVLSDSSVQHYAFDSDGSNSSINQYDGFTSVEQYTSISGGNGRDSAGVRDVSQVVGVGTIDIATGDSVTLAFAIVTGANYDDLKEQALESDTIYNSIRNIDLSISHTVNLICTDSCSGEAGIQAINGISPYIYLWDDLLAQTTDTAIGLCEGSYICTVTDAIGNVNYIPVVITEPSALAINFTDTIMDAGACTGELNGFVSGGTSVYAIDWEDDAGRDSMHAVDLCAGSYRLLVADANGCIAKDTVDIELITGLQNVTSDLGVSMYPNPASEFIILNNDNTLEGESIVHMYDEVGKEVLSLLVKNMDQFKINVSNISSGSYTIVVSNKGYEQNIKFMLAK
jgi:subtilisin family serine protease